MNGHGKPNAVSPIDDAECWRLGGTTSVCNVHCAAMYIWFIIYPVIHVFKDLILDMNTLDLGSQIILLRSTPYH